MNSSSTVGLNHVASKAEEENIKKEEEVTVKLEPLECLVCAVRSRDSHDVYCTRTRAAGTVLYAFLARFTRADLAPHGSGSKHVCNTCLDLINVLEQAEIDYLKIKETFEALLSKNPLFESVPRIGLSDVKSELFKGRADDDSEDEPLARTKKKHSGKGVKKKKKTSSTGKKQKNFCNNKYNWECDECDANGETGGPIALAAHKLTEHTVTEVTVIKTEDNDDIDPERPQSPYNNGVDNGSEVAFDDFEDDDADSTFNPDDFLTEPKKKVKRAIFKRPKEWHPCDQCNARYSSLGRLEQHKQKHDGSKPPYICEVCGAHYKHKRACDIHIALHKGISDWKCEECNKLFPSKNALQRHNNIHTGKLNYQCDLCGKSFIHTSSFKMHKLSHSGVKPHSCEVCGLALMTRSHLKRHARIHSGEKRHECGVCGKRFSERYNLAAHAKSHEAPPSSPERKPEPQRRLFRCHFCTERFERRYMLERHMSALHGRTLERPPPTPRNTMSKLLKAQAQARQHHHASNDGESKEDGAGGAGGAEARASVAAIPPSKLLAQLTSQSPSLIAGTWVGPYAELTYTQP